MTRVLLSDHFAENYFTISLQNLLKLTQIPELLQTDGTRWPGVGGKRRENRFGMIGGVETEEKGGRSLTSLL